MNVYVYVANYKLFSLFDAHEKIFYYMNFFIQVLVCMDLSENSHSHWGLQYLACIAPALHVYIKQPILDI